MRTIHQKIRLSIYSDNVYTQDVETLLGLASVAARSPSVEVKMDNVDQTVSVAYSWINDRKGLGKRSWAESTSSSTIAVALGGIRFGMAIGHVWRTSGSNTKRQRPIARTVEVASQRDDCSNSLPSNQSTCPPPASGITLDQFNAAIPLHQRCTLVQLTPSSCRWPISEPDRADFFFCGGPATKGRVYCAGHCAFAYRPDDQIQVERPRSRSGGGRWALPRHPRPSRNGRGSEPVPAAGTARVAHPKFEARGPLRPASPDTMDRGRRS
jgi:GcrA cell cycle regulator